MYPMAQKAEEISNEGVAMNFNNLIEDSERDEKWRRKEERKKKKNEMHE